MDLLDKLGNKSDDTAKGADNSSAPIVNEKISNTEGLTNDEIVAESNDMLAAADQKASAGSSDNKTSSNDESAGGDTVTDPSSWSMDSALKEIKKLREENKNQRLKYSEKLDSFRKENDEKLQSIKEETAKFAEAQKELEKIKSAEEDKKRSLEEKVSHRETRIAQLEAELEAQRKDVASQLDTYKARISQYEADQQAQLQSYQNRVDEILAEVPEQFKETAGYIVKGAGDPRDALVALNEAKINGLFEEKKVVVNHSVPGASDGARASKEQMENAQKIERSKMSSQQKIAEGLKQIKSGTPNSAFNLRK